MKKYELFTVSPRTFAWIMNCLVKEHQNGQGLFPLSEKYKMYDSTSKVIQPDKWIDLEAFFLKRKGYDYTVFRSELYYWPLGTTICIKGKGVTIDFIAGRSKWIAEYVTTDIQSIVDLLNASDKVKKMFWYKQLIGKFDTRLSRTKKTKKDE